MPDEKILDKIAKLLELADESRGGTPAERELATQRAHEMMLKYNVEMGEVTGRSAAGDITDESWSVRGSTTEWKVKLPILVAQACFCTGYFSRIARFHWRVTLVGRPENIAFVRRLSDQLIPWLEAEAVQSFQIAKEEGDAKPRSFRRAFYQTASTVIMKRLELERQETVGTGMELVRNEDAANQKYLEDQGVEVRQADARGYSSQIGHALGGRAGLRADLATPQGRAVE